jgi:guanylate kinase
MGQLIVIAGPSCVGKSPLFAALRSYFPDLLAGVRPVVLYNDRAPRPGEVDGTDYHFRSRAEIEALRGREHVAVMEVRGDLQALDADELARELEKGDMLFEGNPFIGKLLSRIDLPADVGRVSTFIAPLSRDEVVELREAGVPLESFVTSMMREKLLRRTARMKGELTDADRAEVERRAGSAYAELKLAHQFGCVIPNHDGEDSEHWSRLGHPIGDARRTLHAVADLLAGHPTPVAETWPADLIP